MIANRDANAGTNLILPLARHNFSIRSRYLNTSKEASFVVSIRNYATKVNVCSSRAVVGPLRTGVSIARPAERVASELCARANECVLLLDAIPSFLGLYN